MNRIWIYPLVLLLVLLLLFALNSRLWANQQIKYVTRALTAAMFTYVLGQFLTGVFEIAGTSSGYLIVYSILGGALGCFGLLFWLVLSFKLRHHRVTVSRSQLKNDYLLYWLIKLILLDKFFEHSGKVFKKFKGDYAETQPLCYNERQNEYSYKGAIS